MDSGRSVVRAKRFFISLSLSEIRAFAQSVVIMADLEHVLG
jgi:hypothetical protein